MPDIIKKQEKRYSDSGSGQQSYYNNAPPKKAEPSQPAYSPPPRNGFNNYAEWLDWFVNNVDVQSSTNAPKYFQDSAKWIKYQNAEKTHYDKLHQAQGRPKLPWINPFEEPETKMQMMDDNLTDYYNWNYYRLLQKYSPDEFWKYYFQNYGTTEL